MRAHCCRVTRFAARLAWGQVRGWPRHNRERRLPLLTGFETLSGRDALRGRVAQPRRCPAKTQEPVGSNHALSGFKAQVRAALLSVVVATPPTVATMQSLLDRSLDQALVCRSALVCWSASGGV